MRTFGNLNVLGCSETLLVSHVMWTLYHHISFNLLLTAAFSIVATHIVSLRGHRPSLPLSCVAPLCKTPNLEMCPKAVQNLPLIDLVRVREEPSRGRS